MDKEASIEFILDSILRAAGETLGLRAHQLGRGRAIAGLGIDPEDLPAFAAEIRDAFGAEIPEGWLFREGHTFGDLAGEIFRQASSGKPPCGGSPARAAAHAAPPAPAGPPVPSEGVHRAAREAARAQLTRAGDAAAGAPQGFPPPPDGGGGPAPGENPLEVLGQQMKALYDVFAAQWSRLAGGAAAPPPPSPPPAGPASGPPPAPGERVPGVPAPDPAAPAAAGPPAGPAAPGAGPAAPPPARGPARYRVPSPLELTSSQAEFAEGLVKRFQARTRLSRESLETAGPAAGAGGLAPGPLSGAAYPPVVRHSAGARFLDLDGNDCLDFSLAMGILGHNPPFVTEAVSRTLDRGLPADGSLSDAARGAAALAAPLLGRGARASFFSSEAGAVRAAIILARAVTGRRLVAAFSRCTPGFREHLAFVGDPEGRALPADPGSLLLLDFGTERALSALQEAGPSLACVVAEPAPSSDLRFQSPSYLARLCRAARERGAAVVFDETVLGPGFLPGGAGPRLGSEADLSVWGGGLAGGFPAGILCVSEDFLGRLDLRGAGALGAPAFPLSLAALAAALSWHEANAAGYRERARALLEALSLRLNLWFQEKGAPLRLVSFGPFFRLRRLGPAAPGAAELEGELFRLLLLESGIYTGSREGRGAGRVMAVSAAHGPEDTRALGDAVVKAVLALREGGFGFSAGRGAPRVYVELPPALAPGLAPAGGEGAAPPAREAVAFRAEGQIPVQALREAVLELPSRHEALNRSVSRTADGAWIKTEEEAALVLRVAPDFASETDADAVRPFLGPRDPRLAPPAGAALVERGGSSVFLLESLAAAVDRESLMILLRDVSGLLRRGGKLPPPADLSEAEAEVARYLASDPPWAAGSGKGRAGLSREFWTGELARAGFSRIPLDNPLLRSSGRARLVTRELTGPPLDSYRAWTASSGVAPEIFFAGALALALTRAFPECPGPWLFGRLWQGRPGPLSRAAAGPFARTALLAVPAPSEDAPWTAALQEAFRRSDRHRAVAPEELAGGGRPALPEACVSHEHLHPELLSWPGVEGTFVPLPPSGGSSPVNLHLAEERDRIHLFLKVSEALSPASSRAVLDAFLSAWERLARIPASLLAPEEGPGDEEHFALGGAAPAGRAGGEAAPGVAGAGGPAPEGAVTPGGGAGIGAVDGGAIIDLDTSGVERAPAQPASPAPTGSAEAPFGAEFPEEGERLLPADANPFASFPQPLPPGRREEIEAFYGADLQKALPCAPGQEDWFLPGRLPAPPPSTRVETRRAVMRGVPDPGATIRRARALCEGLDIVRLAVHPGLPPVNALSRRIPKVSEVLRFLDLAGLPLPRRERSLAETALRDAEELSDSSRPGAFRATLVRTGPDSSELMLSTSRLVYDPRSAQKVLEFLVSAPEGARPSFPPLAGALSSLPGPGGLERGLKSRKAALEAVDAPTRIPRRPGFAEARDGGGIQSVTTRLRPETNALLAEAAAREGVPKALFLAGVWAVLLGRLTLSETVVFGLELPGDQGAGAPAGWPVDQAGWPLGPLAIQMPIPARLPWGGTFSDLLKETAAAAAAAARTDFISRGRLAPLTRLGADVFSHGFSYLPAFAPGPGAPEVERVKESGSPGACSLSLNVRDHARMPELHFVYRTALYDHWQVEVIALAFQQVMEDAANSPGATLGSLRLSDPEQDLSLVRQNNARPSRYAGGTVLDLFARAVKENPSSPAVKGGDLAQSYRDLDNESEKFAAQLKVAGYGPRCRVALIFAPGAQEYPQTLLGALKSGACAVPLSTGVPPDLLGQLLAECAPDLVVCSRRLPQNLASCLESLGDTPVVDHQGFYLRGGSSGVMGFSKLSVHFVKRERDRVSIDPDSPAYIVYVSGRLLGGRGADGPEPPAPPADDAASPPAAPGAPQPGGPRGVVVSHRALCNQAAWSGDFLDIAPGDLHCAFATPASDVSLMEILVPLTRGAAVLLLPGGESTAAENLWETVHSHRVTSLSLPLRKLRQYASRHPLYGLKTILTWGRGLSGDNLKGLIKDMSGCRIVNCFGLPECAITSLAEDARPGSFPETMGRPAPNCPSYLLDREMRLVPAGFPGELCCGGVQTALGYDRRPGETARAFTADPFAPLSPPEYRAERLFRTGILARRRPDGRLDYFGRAGERTVIRGVMVPVHEVERTLLGAEGVLEALVVRREDYSFYFEPYLCAYLTLSDDRPASAAAVRRHLADRLPGYMVPERIVILPEFPLDAFGRVDVKALPAPGPEDGAAAGSGGGPEAGAGPAAPRGPGSPPEDEGPPAPAAADLAPVLAPGRDPFAHAPGDMGEAERDRIRARAGDDLALVMPLSPGQCALLAGGGHSPAEPRSVGPMVTTVKAGLRGRLEPQAFRESLRRVINRHDVFRLAIAPRDAGLPVQFWKRGAPRLAEVFTEEDLRFEDARRREARLAALEARHRSDLLDLGRAPLFRASLLRVADDGWELLCSFHRLAFDGWSVEIFFRELWGGAEAPGAPPAPAYASYMERRRAPEARERDLEFWRGELGDLRGPTRLPGRFPLAGEPGVPASLVSDAAALKLPRDLSDAVRGAAAALGAPLECFLLAAWGVLVARATRSGSATCGLAVSGREGGGGLPSLMGPAWAVVPVTVRAPAGAPFSDVVAETAAAAAAAAAHAGVSLFEIEGVSPLRGETVGHLFGMRGPVMPADPGGLRLEGVEERSRAFAFPLAVSWREGPPALEAEFIYDTGHFLPWQVNILSEAYLSVLASASRDPSLPVNRLRLASDQAMLAQLEAEGALARVYEGGTVPLLFSKWAALGPKRPAVAQGAASLTYGDLARASGALAAALASLGVEPGRDRVGLLMDRTPAYPGALLGVFRSGAAAVPLPAGDEGELLARLADAAPRAVVVDGPGVPPPLAAALGRAPGAAVVDPAGRVLLPARGAGGPGGGAPAAPPPGPGDAGPCLAEPDFPAYVCYARDPEGGGGQVGVVISHAALLNLTAWTAEFLELRPEDTQTAFLPFTSEISFLEILTPLASGARTLVLTEEERRDLALLRRSAADGGATSLWLPPGALKLFVSKFPLSPFSIISAAGEGLPSPIRILDPGACRISSILGVPECAGAAAGESSAPGSVPASLGFPAPNCPAYVLDDQGELLPAGFTGELYVGGVQTALGYLNRPDLTERLFPPDPFREFSPPSFKASRLFRTGILAVRHPDGRLYHMGRVPRGEAPLPRLAPPAVRPASASGAFVPLEGAFEAPPVGPAPGLSEAPPPPAGGPAAGRATAPPEFPIAPLDEAAPPGSPAPAAAPEATHGTGFPEDVTAVEVIPVEELPPEGAPAAAPHPAAELVYLSSLAEEEGLAEAPAAAPAAEAAPAAGTPPAAGVVYLAGLGEEAGLADATASARATEGAPAAGTPPAAEEVDLSDLDEEEGLAEAPAAAPAAEAAPPVAEEVDLAGLGEEAELADDLGAAPAPAPPPAGAAPPSGRTARGEAAPGISEGDAVPVEDIEVADDLLDDLGFPVPAPPAPPGPAAGSGPPAGAVQPPPLRRGASISSGHVPRPGDRLARDPLAPLSARPDAPSPPPPLPGDVWAAAPAGLTEADRLRLAELFPAGLRKVLPLTPFLTGLLPSPGGMEGAVTQLRARLSPVGGGRVPSAEEVSAALSVILDRRPELSASYVCDGISHPVRCLPARPLAARAALGVMDLRGEPPEAAEKRARGVLKAQLEALALPERPGKIAVDFLELPGGEADLMLSAHLGAADRGRALAILASLASGDPSVEAAAEAAAVAGAAAQAPASAGDPGATGYAGAEALAAALSGEPAVPLAARAEMDGAWEEILALASEPTALPRRVARAADKERGERRTVPVRFKAGERDALAAAAGREGAGLAGLLAAAWLAFVARLTGNPAPQCAFLGGPPAGAGRAGAFMRPFPLAAAPGGALGGLARDAEALAARTRALGHLSYPEILRLSPWGGRSTDHALAPPPPAPPGGLPPCVRSLSETPPAALASFPLTLFWKDACGLELSLGYSLAAFEPWQAEVMAQGYEIFLRAAAEDPSLTVSEVEILPAEKRHALLSAAAPAAPLPPGTLPERVAADAARDPVAPAVRQGGLTLTYGELASSSSSLAARLRGKGADFADRALVLASRTVGYPAALLGVMRSGSAAAPVSDALPPAELAALAAALEPRWALAPEGADPAILRAIREAAPRAEILGYDGVPRGEAGAAADPAGGGGGQAAAPPPPDPLGVALVLSLPPAPGEEGAGPRLVPVTHLGLANAALSWGMLVQAGPEDVFSALHDPSQPAGLLEILTPLSLAAAAELAPAAPPAGGAGFFDPDAAAAFVRERGVTVLALPEAAALAYLAGHPLSGLKALCALGDRSLGGANLPPETVRGLMAGAGECRVIYAWGPGEALGLALCEPAHPGRLPGSLGGPVYNTPVYVLDREGRLVPSGYPGRLAVGGPQAAASLLPGGRESALSFAQAPGPGPGAPSSARLFLSRAVGRRRPDGRFDLLGIACPAGGTAAGTAAESLRQVERALLEAGGVLDARAAAAGRQILAWVVPRPPREGAEAAELERSLKRALTAWLPASLVPARVTAVKAFTHDRWGRVALPASPAAGGGAAPAPPAPGGKSGDPPPHAGAPARPGPDGGPPRYDPRRYGDGTGAGRPSARPPRTGPRR